MTLDKSVTDGRSKRFFTTLEDRLHTAHNNKYNYAISVYKSVKEKIIVICPIHGNFEIIVNDHLHNNRGCQECGFNRLAKSKQAHTDEELIKLASTYTTQKDLKAYDMKAFLAIKDRGNDFRAICFKHMQGIHRTHEIAVKAIADRYVLLEQFKGTRKWYSVKCVKCDHIQDVRFQKVIEGKHFCSNCHSTKYIKLSNTYPATLYYFEVHQGIFKIGITANTVLTRYSKNELAQVSSVYCKYFINRIDALTYEQAIIATNKLNKYMGNDLLIAGNTELFNSDVIHDKTAWWKYTYIKETHKLIY